MKSILKIETAREEYAPQEVRNTMTVGELISFLQDYDEDMEVVLSFDRGYTYGGITYNRIDEIYIDEEEDFLEDDIEE